MADLNKTLNQFHLYTQAQVDAIKTRLVNDGLARFEALEAYNDFNLVLQRIDLIAILATKNERLKRLTGADEELTVAWLRLTKAIANLGGDIHEMFPDSTRRVSQRITGLAQLEQDGGEYLVNVIGDMPGNMGELAQSFIDKINPGRTVEPENRRLFEYATEYRRAGYGWAESSELIYQRLINPDLAHDDTDKALLNTLTWKRDTSKKNAAAHVKKTYHNVNNSQSLKRRPKKVFGTPDE